MAACAGGLPTALLSLTKQELAESERAMMVMTGCFALLSCDFRSASPLSIPADAGRTAVAVGVAFSPSDLPSSSSMYTRKRSLPRRVGTGLQCVHQLGQPVSVIHTT